MERSLSHGSSSLPRDQSGKGLARLREIASSPIISNLVRLLGADAKLHLVGGTVRDSLLGLTQCDLDISTSLIPEKVKSILERGGIHVVETGMQHGTLTAVCDGQNVEITTFRKPGSRNISEFSSSIEEDLGGRDFTINAAAFSLQNGSLIDPFFGIRDLENLILRAVGDPSERFREDPHRILRMIRFGPSQGRTVEETTKAAAKSLITLLKDVSVERIRGELEKILLQAYPREGFHLMRELGILDSVLPECLASVGFEQNEFHTENVFEHTLTVIENAVPDRIVKWAALFHDLGKPESLSVDEKNRRHFYQHENISERLALQVMHRLKFSNDDMEAIRRLVRFHMRPMECGPAGIRRLIRDLGADFLAWRELKIADKTPKSEDGEFGKRLSTFDSMVTDERNRKVGSPYDALAVDGNDLIALGMKEGRELGAVLKALNELVIEEPELNVKETLLSRARELIAAGGVLR